MTNNKNLDDFDTTEVASIIFRVASIFSFRSFFLDKKNITEFYYYSVILEFHVLLADLTYILDKIGERINFKDHITPTDEYDDITGLVKFCRDAACHLQGTPKRKKGKKYLFASNVFAAYHPAELGIDEITIVFGDAEIHVKHQLVKLYEEVMIRYSKHKELEKHDLYIWALRYGHYQKIEGLPEIPREPEL
jgi:hypothetical protein